VSFFLFSLLAAATATPDYYSADQFKQDCSDIGRIDGCFAFVSAVSDTSRAYQQWMNFREYCLPAGVMRGDLRDATLRYLDLHPREGDALAASVVILALKDRYPCAADPAPAVPATPAK
jgi:hypothetical protein